jgi:hypothetical protein
MPIIFLSKYNTTMISRDIERWQMKDTFAFCIDISFDKNQIIYDYL